MVNDTLFILKYLKETTNSLAFIFEILAKITTQLLI